MLFNIIFPFQEVNSPYYEAIQDSAQESIGLNTVYATTHLPTSPSGSDFYTMAEKSHWHWTLKTHTSQSLHSFLIDLTLFGFVDNLFFVCFILTTNRLLQSYKLFWHKSPYVYMNAVIKINHFKTKCGLNGL